MFLAELEVLRAAGHASLMSRLEASYLGLPTDDGEMGWGVAGGPGGGSLSGAKCSLLYAVNRRAPCKWVLHHTVVSPELNRSCVVYDRALAKGDTIDGQLRQTPLKF